MRKHTLRRFALGMLLAVACASLFSQSTAPTAGAAKQLGSIVKIDGSNLSLATDQGTQVAVKIESGAKLYRLAAGQTDLKSATLIQLTDLQPGDRVLVRGKMDTDGVTLDVSAVIVMKQQDIAQLKQQELADWQRRSVGGLVKQVDSQTGNITLTVGGSTLLVTTTPKTTYKRYAPDSVKWEDASKATIEDIHPGDQLRAMGNKNADGSQLVAEQVVAGTFRNIAGLVTAIDASQSTMTVQDLATKKPVTVKITADSQMKKLPPQLAQGLAMRLKGGTPPAAAQVAAQNASGGAQKPRGDLNQMLGRLPSAGLSDLQKGEAVMIVSTIGSAAQPPMAITLLGGVEPILTAAPAGQSAASLLTPWSLASAPGGDQQ
jgi:hypothetical protein